MPDINSPSHRAARARRAAGTVTDFDGGRLALARRLRAHPRTVLAAKIGVTPAAVTQYERGQSRPSVPVLAQLSLVLGVPADFFRHGRSVQAVPAGAAHFRSLRSTPAMARDQALAFAELAFDVADVIEQYVDLPPVNLPELQVPAEPSPADIAIAAARTRQHFALPPGPVSHVVRLLEAHGVLVLRLPDVHVDPRVDAFSIQGTVRSLVLLSPLKNDKARSRFDAAHELGHLVVHHDAEPGSKLIENQAHGFAAEFLMPAEQVIEDLPRRLDWERLHVAKRRWGTSLRALVYRAHTLGVMSEGAYRRANQQLAQQGNPEAGPLGPPEAATLFGAAAELLAAQGTTTEQLAASVRLPAAQVAAVIQAGSDPRPQLRVAQPDD